MKKEIRKPLNWEDFEDLCKVIWKYEYDSDDIQKNGRQGNLQNGVDIIGFYEKINGYFGIQCKGKDAYNPNAKLTPKEIDEEIIKANKFKPPLKKFIIATTSNKNSTIESYVREKNIESRKKKSFDIVLYSWEDITDLITSHKYVYDWYVKNKMHSNSYKVEVLVNGETTTQDSPYVLSPKYIKETIYHKQIPYDPFKKTDDFIPFMPQLTSLGGNQEITNILYGIPLKENTVEIELGISNIGSGSFTNCDFGIKINNNENYNLLYFEYSESMKRSFSYETKHYKKEFSFLNVDIIEKSRLYIQFPEELMDFDELPSNIELDWYFSSNEHTKSKWGKLHFKIVPLLEEKESIIHDVYDRNEYEKVFIRAKPKEDKL